MNLFIFFVKDPTMPKSTKVMMGSSTVDPFLTKMLPGCGSAWKKPPLKKLVKVGTHGASGHFHSIDSCRIESRIIIDLDAIDPLEDQHAPCDVFVIDTRNVNQGIIFEHLFEAFSVSCLSHVVYFFIDRALKLVVDTHEINYVVHVYESCDDPENELEGAQVQANE